MPTNFVVDLRDLGFEAGMKKFSAESKRIAAFLKRRSHFVPVRSRKRRGKKRLRMPDIHPLSLSVLQMREEEVARPVRTPVTTAIRRPLSTTADHGRRPTAETIRSVRSEGVLIFVEFASDPPELSILKDDDKELLRFPFGMVDPEDKSVFAAAARECREETFFELDDVVLPEFMEANRFGEIRVARDHVVHAFHIVLPAGTPINAGEEQEAAFRAPIHLVEKYIERGLLPQTHIAAWNLAKQKGVIKTN